MRVVVNGEEQEVPGPLSVRELVELVAANEGPVAVERNGEVVPRAEHASVSVMEGDVIEIVHFVGGG